MNSNRFAMKLFSSKTETIVTAIIAAFLVLITLAFTFEPLAALVWRSKDLPINTVVSIKIPDNASAADITFDGFEMLRSLGAPFPEDNALTAAVNQLVSKFSKNRNIAIIGEQTGPMPVTVVFSGLEQSPGALAAEIRLIAAKNAPALNQVFLPDNTFYWEIVADPDQADPSKLPIPLTIYENNGITSLATSTNSANSSGKFLIPTSCWQTNNMINMVSYAGFEDMGAMALIKGIFAYLHHYSCFQSFSTVI